MFLRASAVQAMGAASIILLQFPTTMLLSAFPVAILTVSVGMMSPPRLPVLMTGDYSYGLYLFAYPIQQTYSMLFPDARLWYLNSAFTICCGLLYAAILLAFRGETCSRSTQSDHRQNSIALVGSVGCGARDIRKRKRCSATTRKTRGRV